MVPVLVVVGPEGGPIVIGLPGDRDNDAVANRVAAAPDLLEALEGLLDALPSATTHPAIQAAHAAIAKAKGERS